MNRNVWLVLFLSLIWFGASTYWYMCKIKNICPENITNLFSSLDSNSDKQNSQEGPVSFNWNDPTPNLTAKYDSIMDDLVSRMGENDTLKIVGKYYFGESGEDLAWQRAGEMRFFCTRFVPEERLLTEGLMDEYIKPDKNDPLNAIQFQIIPEGSSDIATTSSDISNPGNNSTYYGDPFEMTVWFRDRTAYKILTPESKNAVQQLVDTLLAAGNYRVDVIGHTDASGTNDENYLLGRQRAWAIKQLLWDMGLIPAKIHTDSKGGNESFSDSPSVAGSSRDQRVEIKAATF